jgi:flavin reductase (DIM6/NTAB) family NADH-FMN oxidoreductase RutF
MQVTPPVLREVMGRLAGGVTVVTALGAGHEPHGFTATAVCSVSMDPPLVLVCVGREAHTPRAIHASGRYALNFLHSGDASASDRFAGSREHKFEGVEWRAAPDGSPLLPDVLAWLECDVERYFDAGDHTIFIGRVSAGRVERPDAAPLIHFGGRYHTVAGADE